MASQDNSAEPVKTLFPTIETSYPHASGGMRYRCPSAGCKRWDLVYVKDGLYRCRDCGQVWRIDR